MAARPERSADVEPPSPVKLLDWDDGFTPSGCNNRPGKIVVDQPRATPRVFQVLENAVRDGTADAIYASAVRAKVWGVFIPTKTLCLDASSKEYKQLVDKLRTQVKSEDETTLDKAGKTRYRHALAQLAVLEFLVAKGGPVITPSDWQSAHGVAVWVIASDCNDETEYHLDYAEMVRYETNVIVPPLYGATLHVSPLQNLHEGDEAPRATNDKVQPFEGGGFHVNLRGLEHYKQYGYKTRLMNKMTTDELEARMASEPGWQSVAYRYRRGILCDGEFPHFSGRVRSLPEGSSPSCSIPYKRVVVGFNLFPHAIGAFVERFPEHSDAFNKYVKLSQTAVKQASDCSKKWSLEELKKNPKQAAFIKYLARKLREKQQHDVATAIAIS
ncbi:hypothetical protein Poli38472_010932 [Pythium oligandrum]|uniref:Uncharacterized protein n=1 Tax=Pythium oligandrum TaxID=41045 RepID=A0A8K1CEB5_PYTOL|nr:hypothetical protein Poli38472_010932 [Pythium oligandrum]|eukprot:TMW61869.1 hypothetical protein Poli38472_010932 [Pythium oligandrum]